MRSYSRSAMHESRLDLAYVAVHKGDRLTKANGI
jgi:hypothetical protein